MTLPKAFIAHLLEHRIRIRLRSEEFTEKLLSRIKSELRTSSQIHLIKINPITGSILLSYDGNLKKLQEFAHQRKLFDLEIRAKKHSSPELLHEKVRRKLEEFDQHISQSSHGSTDLPTLVFAGLMGATAYQIYRGSLFPPALSLLDAAFRTLKYPTKLHEDVFYEKPREFDHPDSHR